jgi:phytoene dehydrogenase-like protein
MPRDRVVVVGSGVAGLVSAFALAARGLDVTVLERAASPGGKMRQIAIGSARIDSGPTVFTMRWVFDELFAAAGRNFADHVRLRPLDILASTRSGILRARVKPRDIAPSAGIPSASTTFSKSPSCVHPSRAWAD